MIGLWRRRFMQNVEQAPIQPANLYDLNNVILLCSIFVRLNKTPHGEHLLVHKHPLCLQHKRTRSGISARHQRTPLAVHGWYRETERNFSEMHRRRRRSCPPSPCAAHNNGNCKGPPVNKDRIVGLDTSDPSHVAKLCVAAGLWCIQRRYLTAPGNDSIH
jgi:hypothetical protein